jgi:uncharacterized damage-inducible protein DinB
MNQLNTLRELYRHHDCAAERVIASAELLADTKLDHKFHMGFGSLRQTLWHNAGAHWLWMTRIGGESPSSIPAYDGPPSMADLRAFWRDDRARRDSILNSISDGDLHREIQYKNLKGEPSVARLGDILLHVANHAQHHHAQASNMLRHLGAVPPRLDYIFMIYEMQPSEPPPLSSSTLQDYFAYTDWAREVVLHVVAQADQASLDRPFEMGIGSIRKNIAHTHDAEAWWLMNWTQGPNTPFPKTNETISIFELSERARATAKARNAFLSELRDADLARPVEAKPSLDRTFSFPLGVTMLQLCNHGTHHRAQTINMLRQCGRTVPPTDFTIWARQRNTQTISEQPA